MKAGDKCPQCKEGLLERSEVGLECPECNFDLEIERVVEANNNTKVTAGDYRFRPARMKIRIATPDEGEEFLRGLIVARANNSNHLFVDLIDSVNELLQPYRAQKLKEELAQRGS